MIGLISSCQALSNRSSVRAVTAAKKPRTIGTRWAIDGSTDLKEAE